MLKTKQGVRPDFSYSTKYCAYCERELVLMNALHVVEEPYVFKALYYCWNRHCGAFDEQARKTYAKVYYSCNEAFWLLEAEPIYGASRREV